MQTVHEPVGVIDPYLRWFLDTHADVFGTRGRDGEAGAVGLVIVWKTLDDAKHAVGLFLELQVRVPRVYVDVARVRRVWAVTVRIARLSALIEASRAHSARIELASPVSARLEPGLERLRGRQSQGETFLAVLDDGCAFGNKRFLSACGTRVAWFWDQDAVTGGRLLDGSGGPSVRVDFGYGREWAKADLDAQLAATPGDDVASAYQALRQARLRRAVVHGTHVMDLFAGDTDGEIAFVQFPAAGIDDPSGRWLARNALDGLHYVLECAGPDAKTIVVNVSWGPQTGPHDGQSVLEAEIDELVAEQRALGRKLIVCLPSGNSFAARAHASVTAAQGGWVDWHVPPDGEMPQFMEVWWPPATALPEVRLRITPPGGSAVAVDFGSGPAVQPGWYATVQPSTGSGAMVLVVVNPTGGYLAPAGGRGAAGRWTIEVVAGDASVPDAVHIYVARADHNMGARRRAKASYLSDPPLAAARFGPVALRDAEAPGSMIRREGTINGLATGSLTRVASGYSFGELGNAPYSSAGPGRNDRRPDCACATDRSRLRQGVAASGVRSGTKAVLVGTSTAAPQMARQFASGPLLLLHTQPTTPPCRDSESRLEPQSDLIHSA